jgi:phenylalanyl-tRNA synthetase beta chain
MKISYNWLKEYLDFNIAPEQLSEILTDCGLEVEELSRWESVKGGLEGIVIGQVIEVSRHPNADKLTLTKVDTGSGEPLSIVCGAPNVAAGKKVVVAPVGTTLYNGDEPWQIKHAKIRGEESSGMICAEDELGLGSSHEGIMVLPEDAPVGLPASEYFDIATDWVFTIGLTPNRIDAASHIGVARDVAAVLNALKNSSLKVKLPDIGAFSVDSESLPVEVIVNDVTACPRYSGLTIKNLKPGPSPAWLANRLKSAGMRPINNIVDITNYVMLELGHPLHAFDMKHVKGNSVVVKKLTHNTDFITLDEVKRKLHQDDLMICNAEEGMCIAGVFGGLGSGVTEETTEIFLESAYFDPVSIRKTSNRHALKTESSFRFERGADPSMTVFALKRASILLKEIAGGEISSVIYDVYPVPVEKKQIRFTHQYINDICGHVIPGKKQLSILRDLDFKIEGTEGDDVTVTAPYAKVDVTRPVDVAEEILRIYGYNNVPLPHAHKSTLTEKSVSGFTNRSVIADFIASVGFHEIFTNSLSPARYYSSSFGFNESKNVELLNPLSSELNVMRRSLIFTGMESVVYNINRKQHDLSFFEFGKVYEKISDNPDLNVAERFHEAMHLVLFMTGNVFPVNWKYPEELVSFFHMKHRVHQILNRIGFNSDQLLTDDTVPVLFRYGLNYSLKHNGKTIVHFGELSPEVLQMTECRQTVFCAEFLWDNLSELMINSSVTAIDPPRFPEVHRDIAVLIDKTVQFDQLRDIVLKEGGELVKTVRLFDIYEGQNIPEGKKSYAINVVLQDMEKTLTDKETDGVMEKIRLSFIKNMGAEIR